MVTFMKQSEKLEFFTEMRTEMQRLFGIFEQKIDRRFAVFEEKTDQKFVTFGRSIKTDVDQRVGVFTENMDGKFDLVFGRLDSIDKKLDLHTGTIGEILASLEVKADARDLISLERRVERLEGKRKV
jgi:hypothetical protein